MLNMELQVRTPECGEGEKCMENIHRVAAVHDLSCFGRCSLAVILPVLSAMGVQACPLPTAVLSTHTGGFGPVARTELAGQLRGTLEHWEGLGLTFDGVYTGYLSSPEQARMALEAVERLKKPGGLALVDPVLGDNGRLYRSVTPELVAAMRELCRRADVITPNRTEAAALLGREMEELPRDGAALARLLSRGGARSVVVTGAGDGPGRTGAAWFDRESGRSGICAVDREPGEFPGTGDLFAAVLTGSLVRGEGLEGAAARAADFVGACVRFTLQAGTPSREGVRFEPLLGQLAAGYPL